MDDVDRPEFGAMLKDCMAQYAKPLPEAVMLSAWWKALSPFPLRVVAAGFASYINDEGSFAPVPAGIVKRCKLLDGRPAAEEAWALALLSVDENETIVWTQEMAEAFTIARPVLDSSGAISARKSFLEAYQRLIDVARFQMRAPVWIVSEGHDKARKVMAIQAAVRTGLLPAPTVSLLLAGPEMDDSTASTDDNARTQIRSVKILLAEMQTAKQAKAEAAPSVAELEDQRSADIAERVKRYRHDIGLADPRIVNQGANHN